MKIKINLNDHFPLEETLNLHNVKILIKSVFDKNQNHCYYNILSEEYSYLLAKN